jgi:D-glucuronyl C5-epimerase-like protein
MAPNAFRSTRFDNRDKLQCRHGGKLARMEQPSRLKLAIRALFEEAVEFSFCYPLMVVPEAGPKNSLHYYLYKYRKMPPYRSVMRLDPNGIAQVWGRLTGAVYKPAFVATYALHNLEDYLCSRDQRCLDIFFNQIHWLEQYAVLRSDGAVVWPHCFDLEEGPVRPKAPWISANAQGLVISALVRAWRITRQPRLWELLKGSTKVFQLDHDCNGVRVRTGRHIVYTEVPGVPAPGIMDGFMRSLLGLYDLYIETADETIHTLFTEGIDGLRHFLPKWDYRQKWSMYSNRLYLCPPGYHCLNRLLLTVLANLTGDPDLAEQAAAWNPNQLSVLDRAEIYLAFLWTKNACRLKYRVWRQVRGELESRDRAQATSSALNTT